MSLQGYSRKIDENSETQGWFIYPTAQIYNPCHHRNFFLYEQKYFLHLFRSFGTTGIKLRKTVNDYGNIITTEYTGASTGSATFVYEIEVKRVSRTPFKNLISREQNGTLQFLNTAEGYFSVNNPPPLGELEGAYVYQYKDHTSARLSAGLGNIRLSYKDVSTTSTPILQILEENNYYPFGLQHKGYNNVVSSNANSVASKFKYNGKELEEELGKDTYAYGWRDYDSAIGRFNKIDRFAELYDLVSPYSFTANNPVAFREIKGDSLQVTSKDRAHIDATVNEVNSGLGGFYNFEVDEDGNASISKTDQEGKATKQQKKLFKTLNKVIKNKKTTSIEIVNNDETVEIGSFDTGQIDIGDVQKLGSSDLTSSEFVSSQGAIAHEVAEQFSKQVKGQTDVIKAHKQGLNAERGVNGTSGRRQDIGAFAINDRDGNPIPGGSSLQSTVKIRSARRTVNIIMVNGNVRNVQLTNNDE